MATEKKTKTDIRDVIKEHLESEERSLAWLSRKTEINYNTLYSIMVHKTITLSEENLKKINTALDTEFKLE